MMMIAKVTKTIDIRIQSQEVESKIIMIFVKEGSFCGVLDTQRTPSSSTGMV